MAYPFLVQDVRGHILGVLSVGDHSLRNWDGKNWVEHPLPRAPSELSGLADLPLTPYTVCGFCLTLGEKP